MTPLEDIIGIIDEWYSDRQSFLEVSMLFATIKQMNEQCVEAYNKELAKSYKED